jgi:hypothetical protein
MSIAQNPLLGAMSKSMGNFTVSSYNGRIIVRSKVFKKTAKQTESQKNTVERFSVLVGVYNSLHGIADLGFPENRNGKSPYNMFISANMTSAFETVDVVPVIHYPSLLISKGSMPVVKMTEAIVNQDRITLKYETSIGLPKVSADDEIIAVAILKHGELLLNRHARGSEGTGEMVLKYHGLSVEKVVCCYVFARSRDGKKASNSVYVELI